MIEKQKASNVLADVEEVLKPVATKHGVTLKVGSTSLGMDDMTTKITFIEGSDVDFEKKEWDRHCHLIGMKPEDFGKRFTSHGTEFTVCGIKPRSRKYPIVGKNTIGTRYKFHRSDLLPIE